MSWLCVSVTSSPVALVSWTVRESSTLSFILMWRLRGHVNFCGSLYIVEQWVEYYNE